MYICFFSSRRRHTRWPRDWSSDVCSSDLNPTQCTCVGARPFAWLSGPGSCGWGRACERGPGVANPEPLRWVSENRSEEHTSELQSRGHLVCRLLLEKKKQRRRRK